MKDGMGWDDDFTSRAGIPQYPCLIDQKHIVGELYDFINVPMVVWIDEQGRVVRPAEPAGVAEDIVRAMDPKTFQTPKKATDEGKRLRRAYVDAIRDWVGKGERSEFALSPEEARRRAVGPNDTDALATANFRLGEYLFEKGHRDEALKFFAEARRLRPGDLELQAADLGVGTGRQIPRAGILRRGEGTGRPALLCATEDKRVGEVTRAQRSASSFRFCIVSSPLDLKRIALAQSP